MGSVDMNDGVASPRGSVPPLAIVGFSFRFPQDATTTQAFWNMMVDKRCASTEAPPDRFNVDAHYHPDPNRTDSLTIRGGHFMSGDLAAFDAPFFSIGATEAAAMDPVHRLTLETAYRAIENAGLPVEHIANTKTCVFSGSFSVDYATMLHKDPHLPAKYHSTGNTSNMQANRVSWFFNLLGPSATIDTACSSSLMALDMVCQSIWAGDSTMGLACGGNTILTPDSSLALDNLGMLGKDSRCFSFDHRANGYARGEGFGVLVVRPLSDALANGDTIRAVIRSSASNQDGRTPGLTQPSKEAQERLILDTYSKASLDMGLTRYFEAHGTGTPVGDPIEAGAIGTAFRPFRSKLEPLYIGSVKSNIGHLEGASGVAGVIKAILALEAGVIPPNSNFEKLNPKIDADFLHIKVPEEPLPWPSTGLRRVSIQSFGFGGANSHVILDDAYNFLHECGLQGNHNTVTVPPNFATPNSNAASGHYGSGVNDYDKQFNGKSSSFSKVLVWSTADQDGIARVKDAWQEYSTSLDISTLDTENYVHDLSYTLAVRRSHMAYRSYAIAKATDNLSEIVRQMSQPVKVQTAPKVGLIFTGQGSQWYAMGRELLARYSVYRQSIVDASIYLQGLGCEWNLLEELLRDESETKINSTLHSQTLCTALQIALIELLWSFGVHPARVVGHSSGEIAAAYCAGGLSKESAWRVAYHRGVMAARIFRSSKMKGGMISIGLSATEVETYLSKVSDELGSRKLVIACINSPKNVTVSGDVDHIDCLQTLLKATQIFARKLNVKVAYHSFQMQEMAENYRDALHDIVQSDSGASRGVPIMVSSVTGNYVSADELAKPGYWVKNMVSPVLFSDALSRICAQSSTSTTKKIDGSHRYRTVITDLVEVGPHFALRGPTREILRSVKREKQVTYKSLLVRDSSAILTVMDVLGHLHCAGHPVNLLEVNGQVGDQSIPNPKALTKLPEYPFNHSKSYWHESRLSRQYRLRPVPRNDLVGVPDSDWNRLEAKWRNVIQCADIPWIEEHRINGVILYPAAGMLCMAIEAAKQLAHPEREIKGFNLKHCTFHSALNIPANTPIEVNLYLQSCKDQNDKDASWYEFRLYTETNSGWHENCNGSVQIVYATADSEVDNGRELHEWRQAHQHNYAQTLQLCSSNVDVDWLYDRMVDNGYSYGPAFRAITSLRHNGNERTVTTVRTFKWKDHYESPDAPMPHVIHPTTFDCILQSILASYSKGGTIKMSTTIPTHFDHVWISKHGLSGADADFVRVYASTERVGSRETSSSVVALDASLNEVLVEIKGFTTTDIDDSAREKGAKQESYTNLCHNLDWAPDFDLMSTDEIQSLCDLSVTTTSEPESFLGNVDLLITACIKRTLDSLDPGQILELEKKHHTRKYLDWMKHRTTSLGNYQQSVYTTTTANQHRLDNGKLLGSLIEKLSTTNKQGIFYANLVKLHQKFLTGEEDPLAFLFQGDMVKDFYNELWSTSPSITRFRHFLGPIVHKNLDVKLLEVGAGTGATTQQVMNVLTHHGDGESCIPRYGTYDYTDISPFFFGGAKEIYRDHGSKMRFQTLNIEEDPAIQGFECGTYDIVFAAAVLHATRDLAHTLKNCRKLLKPGGKLIIWEIVTPDGLRTNFAFGLLEGWWLSSEPWRSRSPCIDEDRWDSIFRQTGFSGNDLVLRDYKSPVCHEFSVICTTAVETTSLHASIVSPSAQVAIIHTSRQVGLAAELKSRLALLETFSTISTGSVDQALQLSSRSNMLYVFLLEFEKPIWSDIDEDLFEKLKSLLTCNVAAKTLWVSRNDALHTPAYHLVDGLSRVLNSEADSTVMTCLSLAKATDDVSSHQIDHIVKLARLIVSKNDSIDTEYVERDGHLQIPRLIESTRLNNEIHLRQLPRKVVSRKWNEGSLQLLVGTPGLLNTLHFAEDTERDQPLPDDMVEVQVQSVGLNFRDVLIALGRLNQSRVGCECAGVITRLGANGERSDLRVGDRVAAVCSDSYRSFARIDRRSCARIPDGMSFSVAASIPVNYCTAWRALHDIACLQHGETVLIHSAAGGTGQSAVQVAQHHGATIFATVGSNTKKRLLIERYGIPETHIFSSRDTTFAKGIKRLTNGIGVDCVLNSLSGEGLIESWDCIAPFGRFIEVGKKDILAHNKLQMSNFEHNVSFNAIDINLIRRDKPEILRVALEKVFGLMEEGRLRPVEPLQVYSISEVESALQAMQSGKTSGKIIIEMRSDANVEALIETKPSFTFEANATYVIAGGLGGIGRSVATWFVKRGARNLILLSRSGIKNSSIRDWVTQLVQEGTVVKTPAVDVGDMTSLRTVLHDFLKNMPPIKGCIQASMVLHDATFGSMSFAAWRDATQAKVDGTWNLHSLLPRGMDFFIMFSSIAGVFGSKGQANYAAGNTFQDAVARYRVSMGEKAAAFDLGPFFSIGVMNENMDLQSRWKNLVDTPVTETNLWALLDYHCDPSLPVSSALSAQVTVGLARGLRQDNGSAYYIHKPMFRNIALESSANRSHSNNTSHGASSEKLDLALVFNNASDLNEATDAVKEALACKLTSALSLNREEVDLTTPMHTYGVDSLVAVELRNWFAKEVRADVAIFDILGDATITATAALAAAKSQYRKEEWKT